MPVWRWLRPPPTDEDPRATLEWVRRVEIVTGIACLVLAAALWDVVWLRWVLIGCGIVGLFPWPGVRAVLRKAERNPDVLISDPERRRERAKRATLVLPPAYTLAGAGVGFAIDGWGVAIFMGVLAGLSACLGAYWVWRRGRVAP